MKYVEWFKHDNNARNDQKLQELRRKKGYGAKAIYWDLVEIICEHDGVVEIEQAIKEVMSINNIKDYELIKYVIKESGLFTINGETINSKWLNERLVKSPKGVKGENHWNWNGGITPDNLRIRHSEEYSIWRRAVFVRDNYTCQRCRIVGGELEAHHIKPFSKYPNLRFEVNNGITLCRKCHKEIHKKAI